MNYTSILPVDTHVLASVTLRSRAHLLEHRKGSHDIVEVRAVGRLKSFPPILGSFPVLEQI